MANVVTHAVNEVTNVANEVVNVANEVGCMPQLQLGISQYSFNIENEVTNVTNYKKRSK
jgi:hypothetical protein